VFQNIHLQSLTISASGEDTSTVLKAFSGSPTANSLQKADFYLKYETGSDIALKNIHQVLSKFVNCGELSLNYGSVIRLVSEGRLYQSLVQSTSLILPAGLDFSLGVHKNLTSLEIFVEDFDEHFDWLLRGLLFEAHLPILKRLTIVINIYAHSVEYEIPLEADEQPILPESMARSLECLTFYFDWHDDDLVIVNWSKVQALFGIDANSEVIKYECGSKGLPKLV
jgi:hypothetical protein